MFRATGLYLVAIWGLTSGAVEILPSFGVPAPWIDLGVVAAFCATPAVAILAWLYEIRGGRVVRDQALPSSISAETVLPGTSPAGVVTVEWLGQRRLFARDFVIGRDEVCDVQVVDPMISRQHVRLTIELGRWQVVDLLSSNGTRLDGRRIDRADLPTRSVLRLYDGGPPISVTLATAGARTEVGRELPPAS